MDDHQERVEHRDHFRPVAFGIQRLGSEGHRFLDAHDRTDWGRHGEDAIPVDLDLKQKILNNKCFILGT